MRLRNIKNKEDILNNSKYLVKDIENYKGKWKSYFNNDNPIYIEIGMGFGKFIVENAKRNPNINFIGIEKQDNVLARCLPKIEEGIDNLAIIRLDALNIDNIFDNEISRIYLNFSDPWPKKRHASRRLTSEIFLKKYENIFCKEMSIYMRTDNQGLFISSIESLSSNGYVLSDISFNLHNDKDELITTEYEDKFVNKGVNIYSLVASKNV